MDYFARDITTPYALFAIGHLVHGASYGRFYTSIEEFKQKAQDREIPFYDEIDAAVYETYGMVPQWKRGLLLVLSPVLAVFILGLVSMPLRFVANHLHPGLPRIYGVLVAVALVFFVGFAWALAFFLLIEDYAMYERDVVMSEVILRIADDEGYETILVSCGGTHRTGIATHLEEEGWEVDERTTDSWIGKVLLWSQRIIESVLNPRRTLTALISKLRNSNRP